MADSPTGSVWDALGALIDGGGLGPLDVAGQSILQGPRFYRGTVEPEEEGQLPPPGYFLFGAAPEDDDPFVNGQDGVQAEYTVHCWARTIDDANRLYRWLKALILADTLPVDGFTVTEQHVGKGRETPDPSGTAWQVPLHLALDVRDLAA